MDRILQSALSGNAYISIICTISPTVKCSEESHNTLKFAYRAKKIKMKADVNEVVDDKTLLSQYREEINQLKAQVAKFENMAGESNSSSIKLEVENLAEKSSDFDTEDREIFLQVKKF